MPAVHRAWMFVLSVSLAGCSQQTPVAAPLTAETSRAETEPALPRAPDPIAETVVQPPLSRVQEILAQMSDFYRRQSTFRVTGHLRQAMESASGEPLNAVDEMPTGQTLVVQKPNRVAFQMPVPGDGPAGEPEFVRFVSDGKTLSIEVPFKEEAEYCVLPAPSTLTEVMTEAMAALEDVTMFAVLLGDDDPAAAITEDAESIDYVGVEEIDGVPAHHLHLIRIGQMSSDLWIAAEGDPVVLQSKFQVAEQRLDVDGQGPQTVQILIVNRFQGWDFAPAVPDDVFTFTPTEGAHQVPTLRPAADPSPLIGRPAPPIDLPLVGGGRLDLAQHRGKEVVVLDFWATWCAPCVAELPGLALISRQYADKGVVLYAVNQMEDEATITEFLEQRKLGLNVALDAESAASEAFGADGAFPHLAIVDRNGIVQFVHSGYWPGIKFGLRHKLDAILAGRDLFEPKSDQARETPASVSGGAAGPSLPAPRLP